MTKFKFATPRVLFERGLFIRVVLTDYDEYDCPRFSIQKEEWLGSGEMGWKPVGFAEAEHAFGTFFLELAEEREKNAVKEAEIIVLLEQDEFRIVFVVSYDGHRSERFEFQRLTPEGQWDSVISTDGYYLIAGDEKRVLKLVGPVLLRQYQEKQSTEKNVLLVSDNGQYRLVREGDAVVVETRYRIAGDCEGWVPYSPAESDEGHEWVVDQLAKALMKSTPGSKG